MCHCLWQDLSFFIYVGAWKKESSTACYARTYVQIRNAISLLARNGQNGVPCRPCSWRILRWSSTIFHEMKVWSSQLWLRFKHSQLSPKNIFGASTGFEPMAFAIALQCSTSWAMKTHTLEAGQFVEFIAPVKGMKHMNIIRTADMHNIHVSFLSRVRWIQQIGLLSTYGSS